MDRDIAEARRTKKVWREKNLLGGEGMFTPHGGKEVLGVDQIE